MDFIKLTKPPQDTPRTQIRKFDNNDKNKATQSVNSNNNNQVDSIITLETSSSPSAKKPATNTKTTKSETNVSSCSDTKDRTPDLIEDDPGIQSLMEISLPSPGPSASMDECNFYFIFYYSFFFFLMLLFVAADFNYNSNPPMSPMTILRQSPTDPKWFEENVNDFSLSSFLGHLDACEGEKKSPHHEVSTKICYFLCF